MDRDFLPQLTLSTCATVQSQGQQDGSLGECLLCITGHAGWSSTMGRSFSAVISEGSQSGKVKSKPQHKKKKKKKIQRKLYDQCINMLGKLVPQQSQRLS